MRESFRDLCAQQFAKAAAQAVNSLYVGHTKIWIEVTSQYRER